MFSFFGFDNYLISLFRRLENLAEKAIKECENQNEDNTYTHIILWAACNRLGLESFFFPFIFVFCVIRSKKTYRSIHFEL
jgi:hypothetical protein